jgi:FlaA1/EpsC-like NDP-sugar epimerase
MTTFLITGAAGSLGRILVEKLSRDKNNVVRAFDIDEYGLSALPKGNNIRKILGSITNTDQIARAIRGVNVVFHCAAIKNLDISEYNVQPLIETNINGTYNVAMACQEHDVTTAVFMSSDKACSGISTYGVTKLAGEKIWGWAARISTGPRFITLRSGNFCESRGNVFEVWHRQIYAGERPTITDIDARRYFIKTEAVADLLLFMATQDAIFPQGTITVPKMKEHNILEMFRKFYPHVEYEITGLREGEVLREELLCRLDTLVQEYPNFTVVQP